MVTRPSRRARPAPGSRRAGYTAALIVNVFLLVALNYWPGWDVVPFLTSDTSEVMAWVDASLIASVVANALYLSRDPEWLKALGDAVTTAVGLVAVIVVWRVFPFEFDRALWENLGKVLLGVAAVGSVLGIIGAVARLIRSLLDLGAEGGDR